MSVKVMPDTRLNLWRRQWQGDAGLALVLRISCFISIALGILSLLSRWFGHTGLVLRLILVTPEEALGLIFMGFAVRMSRLEAHRPTIRIIVQTSRVCLVLLGASLVGLGHAAGACYLAIGLILMMKYRLARNRMDTVLTALICTYLGSCWVSLLLARAAMAPIPAILQVDPAPLLILSAISYVLSSATRAPGMLKVLVQRGPEAEAARVMFPLAFAIPLVLAFLRHQAERLGLLQPDLGLLLHVLLSAGSMAGMIVWNANRIHSAQRIRESTDAVVADMETQYHAIFAVMRDPVWVFSSEGPLEFSNAAAQELNLDPAQQRTLLSAAMLDKRMIKQLDVQDRLSGAPRTLAVQYLRVLLTPDGEPGSVVMVAHVLPPQQPSGLETLVQVHQEDAA